MADRTRVGGEPDLDMHDRSPVEDPASFPGGGHEAMHEDEVFAYRPQDLRVIGFRLQQASHYQGSRENDGVDVGLGAPPSLSVLGLLAEKRHALVAGLPSARIDPQHFARFGFAGLRSYPNTREDGRGL
jgi:hypothetical protein